MDSMSTEFGKVHCRSLTSWIEKQGNKRDQQTSNRGFCAQLGSILNIQRWPSLTPYNTGYLHRTVAPPFVQAHV